jgi:hypothetical protein
MIPFVLAQAMAEYGVVAAVSARVSSLYSQIEYSVRTDTDVWLLSGFVVVVGFWWMRRG